MKIVLLRHGKPNVPEHGKLRAKGFYQWIESYNSSGLFPEPVPPQEAINIVSCCNTVVCSDLPRSIESAHALGIKNIHTREPIFREVGLPYGCFPSPKLSPNAWAGVFRLIWFIGYSSNSESINEAKLRAAKGAKILSELAGKNRSVLLVGHGFINWFIAKKLIADGWRGPANPGKRFWEFGVYEHAFQDIP